MKKYDVIIIGRGPAGLQAALYTTRGKLDTLIIGRKDGALKKALKIDNYFGFDETVSGDYLIDRTERQALKFGATIIEDEVVSITKEEDFEVVTTGEVFHGTCVLLATGQSFKRIRIKDMDKFEGNGISYCTTCDGFFYRDLKTGVLGHKDFAVHEAIELETYTKDITIYTNGHDLDLSDKYLEMVKKFKVVNKKILGVKGKDFLEELYFEDGSNERVDGIFIALDSASSTDFAKKLGVITEGASIVTDRDQKTNLEGLYAAGDCTNSFKQISTAVGSGAVAAKSISDYIKSIKQ